MWARISEICLAIWLFISRWIFSYGTLSLGIEDFLIPAMILLFAALSYIEKLNKMHLLQVIPALWLLWISYTYPTPWLPFGLQNHILTALFVLMLAIIPSHASDHPRPWKKFLKSRDRHLP